MPLLYLLRSHCCWPASTPNALMPHVKAPCVMYVYWIYSLSHRLGSTVCTHRDESFSSLSGRNAIIYQGTMDPEGTRVAIKSLHLSPSANKAAGEVHALHCHNIRSSD
ncbi:hypothetical protein SCLCIDRAFT_438160 [Scleroderma citrinum Foug A]|uniref:Protein kinase domain-containing protein n=1 Tax=Scleroderma citrinum Foug A TaxID=1036808 RepID=A0A0C3CXW5_9AGAM|nr:hypothetical protein SCLCIDRAFT_438160 [Scleroderma citrinum Foug A]